MNGKVETESGVVAGFIGTETAIFKLFFNKLPKAIVIPWN